MMPLAKPANRFRAVRLPMALLRSMASDSLPKSDVKLLQQSIKPPFARKKVVYIDGFE
jgi:hypothetical protein